MPSTTDGYLAFLDGTAFRIVEVRPGITRIGRSMLADVWLDATGISPRHALLRVLPDGRVELIDDRSLTGTRFNGVEVTHRILHHGDTISIAGRTLSFVAEPSFAAGRAAAPALLDQAA